MQHFGSLLLGLGGGGVFAAIGVALVVTYRSSGVINFATGAIALLVAYIYAGLRRGELLVIIPGLPESIDLGRPLQFWPALAISMLLAAIFGALLYLLVFRPMRESSELARAVISLGVLVVIQGTMAIRFGTSAVTVAPIFPAERWELGSVFLLSDRFYMALSIVVLTILLAAAYRYTRFGLTTRAVAETQKGAYISGISPDRVALANWVISAMVAGIAGILIAPTSPLTPITYTLFVVPALAAAVVGRFQYLVPTALAGLGIGMLQSEATFLAAEQSWMPTTGAPELVPLLVILIALLFTRRGLPRRGEIVRSDLGRAPRPRSLALPTVAGSAVGVLALLLTSGSWRAAVIGTFIAAVIGLSLVLVTGYAGQISLAQLALAGTAAFMLSFFTQSWSLPFPVAPLLACIVATAIGVLVGLPALRVRGLMLGVVTLALAYAIEAVWFRNTQIVGVSGARVEQPSLFGLDLSTGTGTAFPRIEFGLLCLATLVGVAFGVAKLRQSRLGSAMLAVRANERSAAGVGVNVVGVKVASFAMASFIAGIGGCLLAYRRSVVTFDSFTALGGLALLTTAYLAGLTSVWGGVMAGILASTGIVFIALDRWVDLGTWFPVISGVALIVTLIFHPEGLSSFGHRVADWLASKRRAPVSGPEATEIVLGEGDGAVAARDVGPEPGVGGSTMPRPVLATGLRTVRLTVRYGGVVAVSEANLEVPVGQVVGLIGPNGAGKTSVIDAVTGFAPATGTISLGTVDLAGMGPHRRVRQGVARTFQSLELYDDLSVEENLSVAVLGADRDRRHHAVWHALDRVGIPSLRHRTAGELSQGERQLVSIARACVAEPSVLLLDEPAAGLNPSESSALGRQVSDIALAGTGILLVDHDVHFVLGVCDHIYVLDRGSVIAEGSAEEIRADSVVADAYLGVSHEGRAAAT
jgi:ABC-type branched-subunit amino acid transport system ATPase component/branched-subunit amino acid ABC-type transport system permease component